MVKALSKLFLRWGWPYMIVWVCGLHLVIGVGLLVRPQTAGFLILSGLNRFTELPLIDRHVLAWTLIIGAVMSVMGIVLEGRIRPKATLALLIVQYGVVLGSFLSDAIVLWNGVNPATGAAVDRIVIFVVLAPILLAGPLHTLSIVERFVMEPRRGA